MEKRVWTMPQAVIEQFEMNAYCASACGDNNTVYKFTCNAGEGKYGRVVGADGVTEHYYACYVDHTTDVLVNDDGSLPSDFIYGTYEECQYFGLIHTHKDPINVIIWRDTDGNNTHCTTVLNHNSWPTDKS